MPTVTNDLFKVILSGTYFSQEWHAVHWYYNFAGVGTLNLGDVAQDYNDETMSQWGAACNTDVTFTNIRVVHVNGTLADVNLTPTVTVGLLAGSANPPFIAASIRLNRTTKETRNGWKRIIGSVEESMGALSWAGSYITLLNALGTAFMAPLSMGGALNNLVPVIVRTVTPTTWVYNDVASVQVINQPTTQNSRKVGTGI